MTGEQIERMRLRLGLTRQGLADELNKALGKNYGAETIARWERGRKPAKWVDNFLEELAVQGELDAIAPTPRAEPVDDSQEPPPGGPEQPQDTPPPGPAGMVSQPPIGGGGAWTRPCEELWQLIATGVGMVGAATGNMALVYDGQIIDADKQALGAAWGRLAETNETFRKMLVGMTEGGAWLQVAMVTGTTVSNCWANHQRIAAAMAEQAGNNGHHAADEFERNAA